jgi:hypothetical protein
MGSVIIDIVQKIMNFSSTIRKKVYQKLKLQNVEHDLDTSEKDLNIADRMAIKVFNALSEDDWLIRDSNSMWRATSGINVPLTLLTSFAAGSYFLHLIIQQSWSYQDITNLLVLTGSLTIAGESARKILTKNLEASKRIDTEVSFAIGFGFFSLGFVLKVSEPLRHLFPEGNWIPHNYIVLVIIASLGFVILGLQIFQENKWGP